MEEKISILIFFHLEHLLLNINYYFNYYLLIQKYLNKKNFNQFSNHTIMWN